MGALEFFVGQGGGVEPLDEVLEVLRAAVREEDDTVGGFEEAWSGVYGVEGGSEEAAGGAEGFAVDEEGLTGGSGTDVDGGDGGEEVAEGERRVQGCEGSALGGGGRGRWSFSGWWLVGGVGALEALSLLHLTLLFEGTMRGGWSEGIWLLLLLMMLRLLLGWRGGCDDGTFRLERLTTGRIVSKGPAAGHARGTVSGYGDPTEC